MNNIGFAATKNTAVNTNNNVASSTANLNSLATAFGGASSSVGGGFNSLILGLFIQIIQTLLKNMQNKPCCDQTSNQPNKQLKLSEQELTRLDRLPNLDKQEPGHEPTIKNIIDNDKNNKLSAGDTVHLSQVTNELDTNGQAIVKSYTKALTENDINIFNSLKAPNQLSAADTSSVQEVLNQGAFGASGAPRATGGYYDRDASGTLSLGDEAEVLSFQGPGAPTPTGIYNVGTRLIDEAFLAKYQPNLNLNDTQKDRLTETLSVDYKDPNIVAIKDNDQNGILSAGDTVYLNSTETRANGPVAGEPGSIINSVLTLSQAQVDRFQSAEPITHLQISNAQKDALDLATTPIGAQGPGGNLPRVSSVIDTDNNGLLSVGDIVNKRASSERAEAIFGNYYTYESYSSAPLTQEQLDAVNQS